MKDAARLRSAFNHDWLKNRFMLTVYRARQASAGRLSDDLIASDLAELCAEWPDIFKSVRPFFASESDPSVDELRHLLPGAAIQVLNWLASIQRICHRAASCQDATDPADADHALAELDCAIRETVSGACTTGGPSTEHQLNRLLAAATRVSDIASALGRASQNGIDR